MILNFIKSIFHYELYILPIYLIIRLLYLRNKKINIKRELLLIIFASTIIMLLSQAATDLISEIPEWYIRRDIFDIHTIEALLDCLVILI